MIPCRFTRLNFLRNVLNEYTSVLRLQSETHILGNVRHQSYFIPEVDEDKSKLFFSKEAQGLMKKMTGMDLDKIYRRRTIGDVKLQRPKIKFFSAEQLKQAQGRAIRRAYEKLQMPPLVPVNKEEIEVLEEIPEMIGFTKSKYVFTDISFGISDKQRLIVVREPSGVLRKALPDERRRMCELYFPRPGRSYLTPKMFQPENLKRVLEQGEYEFILDRACAQFEPDDKEFHQITFTTYSKINEDKAFNKMRSTRYYGPIVFYLCMIKNIESLLEENLQTERLHDAVSAIRLYSLVNPDCKFNSVNADPQNKVEYVRAFIESEKLAKGDMLSQLLDTYWEADKKIVNSKGG